MNGSNPYISLSEAGKISGYTAEYLRQLCVKGKLEGAKIGKSWVTTASAVAEFKARQIGEPVTLDQVIGTSVFSYSKVQKLAAVAMAVLVFAPVAANLVHLTDRIVALRDRTNQIAMNYLREQLDLAGQVAGISTITGDDVNYPPDFVGPQQPTQAPAPSGVAATKPNSTISQTALVSALRELLYSGLPDDLKLALQGPAGPVGAVGASGPMGPAGANGITTIVSSAYIPNSGSVFGITAPTAQNPGTIGSASYLSSKEFQTETILVTQGSNLHNTTITGDLILSGNFSLTGPATVTGDLLPGADDIYALGSSTKRWNILHAGSDGVVVHNDITDTAKVSLVFSGATAQLLTDAATSLQLTAGANLGINISTNGNVGINTTAPGSNLDVRQSINGNNIFYGKRITDTLPTGNFLQLDSAAGANLFSVDVLGGLITTGNFTQTGSATFTTGTGLATVGGNLTLSGNDTDITFTGTGNHDITATSGTLRLGSNTIIGNIEALDNTIDIGTPATRFDKIYANEVNASTLVGTISGGNVSAETLSINSDNATADTEDSFLAFERGSVSPNGLLQWDSTNDKFALNGGLHITNTIGSTYGLLVETGNVGIGTTNPTQKLSVAGNIAALDYILTGGSGTTGHLDVLNSSDSTMIELSANGNSYLNGGNVGIGTTNPGAKLEVNGDIFINSLNSGFLTITNANTTSGSPRIVLNRSVTGSPSSWWLGDSRDTADFDIYDNNSSAIRLTIKKSTGNIGIGTTNPGASLEIKTADSAYVTKGFKITDSGGNSIVTTTNDQRVFIGADDGGDASLLVRNRATGSTHINIASFKDLSQTGTPELVIKAAANQIAVDLAGTTGSLAFGNLGTAASQFVINTTSGVDNTLYLKQGNVGIATTNPIHKLDIINGTTQTGTGFYGSDTNAFSITDANIALTSGGANLVVTSNTAAGIDVGSSIGLGGRYLTGSNNDRKFATIKGAKENATDNNQNGYLAFGTYNHNAGATAERMRIDSSGNVGIGTTNPAVKLEIQENASSLPGRLRLSNNFNTIATNDLLGDIQFYSGDLSVGNQLVTANIQAVAEGLFNGGAHQTGLAFLTATNAGSPAEALRISGTGNVGIGTTNPASKLDIYTPNSTVNGLAIYGTDNSNRKFAQMYTTANEGTLALFNSDGTTQGVRINSGTAVPTYFNGGNVGIGTTNPGNLLSLSGTTPTFQVSDSVNGTVGFIGNADDLVTGTAGRMAIRAENGLYLSGGGNSQHVFVNTSGNVGIGIASPAYKLHVVDSTAGGRGIQISQTGATGTNYGIVSSVTGAATSNTGGYFTVTGATTNYGVFITGTPTAATNYAIYSEAAAQSYFAGNVGIGTTNPASFKLEVAGNIGPDADNTRDLGSAVKRFANLYATTINGALTPTGFTEGSVVFATTGGTLAQDNTNFFWNDTLNRLGVGTSSPASLLHVYGTNASGGIGASITNVGDGGISTTPYAALNFYLNSIRNGGAIIAGRDSNYGSAAQSDSNLQFYTSLDDVNTERMRITSGGNVGIGTTNPTAILTVSNSTVPKINLDVSGSERAYLSYTEASSTLRLDSDSTITLAANNAVAMTILASGNVGIGTTIPGAKLDVNGVIKISDAASYLDTPEIRLGSGSYRRIGYVTSNGIYLGYNLVYDATTDNRFEHESTGALGGMYANVSGISFFTGTSQTAGTAATERVRIDTSGNLGIGTTSPLSLLTIGSGAPTTAANGLNFGTDTVANLYRSGVGTISTDGNFVMAGNQTISTAGHVTISGSAGLILSNASNGTIDNTGSSTLYIQNSGNTVFRGTSPSFAEQFRVAFTASAVNYAQITGGVTTAGPTLSAQGETNVPLNISSKGTGPIVLNASGTGNVGIGTTNPQTKLNVVTSNAGQTSLLRLKNSSGLTNDTADIDFVVAGSETVTSRISSARTDVGVSGGSDLAFSTYGPSTFLTERMRILASGNVGIGTTNPGSLLHVETNASAGARLTLKNTSASANFNAAIELNAVAQNANARWTIATGSTDDSINAGDLYFRNTVQGRGSILLQGSTGYVGIGTTNPTSPLHVAASGATTDYVARIVNTQATRALGLLVQTNTASATTSDPVLQVTAGSDVRFKVETGGNVGIGTTNPGVKLDVVGTIRANDGTAEIALGSIAGVRRMQGYATGQTIRVLNTSNGYASFGAGSLSVGSTYPATAAPTDGAIIEGNVGIGTATPGAKFDLRDGNLVLTDADVAHGMTLLAPTAAFGQMNVLNGTGGGLHIKGLSDTNQEALFIDAVIGSSDPTDSTTALLFRAGKSNTTDFQALGALETAFQFRNYTTNLMTILGSGNVGIGSTNPGTTLDVTGTGRFSSTLTASSGFTVTAGTTNIGGGPFNLTGGLISFTNTAVDRQFIVNGTATAVLDSNAESVRIAGTITEFSSGTHPMLSGLRLQAPTITAGAAAVTDAATLYISGPTTATVTGGNYALYSTSGTNYFGGSVGIGTTGPLYPLDVSSTSTAIRGLVSTADGQALVVQGGSGSRAWALIPGGTGSTKSPVGGLAIYDGTAGQTRMSFDTSGNVGIGTTNPAKLLQVGSDSAAIGSFGDWTINGVNGTYKGIGFPSLSGGFTNTQESALISYVQQGNWGADIVFATRGAGGGSGVERMRISQGGNVGIGTTNPGNILDVQQNTTVLTVNIKNTKGSGQGDVALALDKAATGNSSYIDWRTGGVSEWVMGTGMSAIDNNWRLRESTLGINVIVAEQTGAVANTLYLKTGNVGIGTTNPANSRLHVSGSVSSTAPNGLLIDASVTSSGVGSSSNLGAYLNPSMLPAPNDYSRILNITGNFTEAASGAHADLASVVINTPTVTGGVATVTNTYGLYIAGAPNATVTGGKYAIYSNTDTNYFGGSVGIGTTAPSDKFHVLISGTAPTLATGNNSDHAGIFQVSGTTGANARVSIVSGNAGSSILELGDNDDSDIGAILYEQATNRLNFRTNNTNDRMVIDSSGNVGIGTTSPTHLLDLIGSVNTLRLSSNLTDATTKEAKITLAHYTNAEEPVMVLYPFSTATENSLWIGGGSASQNALTNIVFATGATTTTTAGTERMRITSAGNVGIGTTNPVRILTVNGGASTSHIILHNTTSGSSIADGLDLAMDGTDSQIWNYENGYISLGTNNTERVRVDSAGSVSIGTTNPGAYMLNVAGIASLGAGDATILNMSGSGYNTSFSMDGTGFKIAGNSTLRDIRVVANTGGVVLAAGATAWAAISDERLKDVIAPLDHGLEKLKDLRTILYKLKADSTNTSHIGLIAQEVQRVYPEAVSVGSDGFLSLRYTELIPPIINAVQELDAKNTHYYQTSSATVGDLVKLASSAVVEKSTSEDSAIGVVTSVQGSARVEFTGQMKVRVSEENGLIHAGDRLTLSTQIPGAAAKMTESGQSIGTALQDSNGSGTGMIQVFVSIGYQKIQVAQNPEGQLVSTESDLDMNGFAIINVKSIASLSGKWSIDENGLLVTKEIHTEKLCVGLTCVTEEELKTLLQNAGLDQGTVSGDSTPPAENPPADPGAGEQPPPAEEPPPADSGNEPPPPAEEPPPAETPTP